MQLPPERTNEPEWLQVQRRVRKAEQSWNYGAWTATAAAGLPYALIIAIVDPALAGKVLLAASIVILVAAVLVLRRAPKGTFVRGLAIWSVPFHALSAAVFLAMILR